MASPDAKETILIVDNAPDTLEVLRRNLVLEGYRILAASGVAAALEILKTTAVDLVITDLKMPDASGMELVHAVRRDFKETEIMMITGYATVEGAVQAVKAGAQEFLAKPFTEEELLGAVRRALGQSQDHEAASAAGFSDERGQFGCMGESEAMRAVLNSMALAAKITSPILITGERGTGKELAARAIHYQSPRAEQPFVVVRCGFIPGERLDAEVFGSTMERASGDSQERQGYFHLAAGGTIFFKEVGELAKPAQARLERLLGSEEGSRGLFPRVMASTSKKLGTLREDYGLSAGLLAKLSPHEIRIPPLRERAEDVAPIVHFFLKKAVQKGGYSLPAIADPAMEALKNYSWPGNAREVQTIVELLVKSSGGGVIELSSLPPALRLFASGESQARRPLAQMEADYIRGVLASVNNNKTLAARILCINRKTLREKLRK